MITARFKNIGPIKDATLELGDLTIIAGQNNTGKTYLVYTLYGFLQFWNHDDSRFFYGNIHTGKFYERIQQIAQRIEKTGTASIKSEEYREMNDWTMREASRLFSENFIHREVFNSPKDQFKDATCEVVTGQEKRKIVNRVDMSVNKGEKIAIKSVLQDGNLKFEVDNPGNITDSGAEGAIYFLIEKTMRNNYLDPYILSAERFGISLFYKELDFTRSHLLRLLQKSLEEKEVDPYELVEKRSARYALPISDNINFTRYLSDIQKQKSILKADKNHSVEKIVDGYYKVVKDEILFISKKRGRDRFVIPLHLASSSARGLSDLYFYLKHIAKPGQMLIIDEPESHLSPANQILMARLLVFCVSAGLKVIVTTHSDYIIKEIDNLIMLNSDFPEKERFLNKHKKDYTETDRLNPESVRAYICEGGTLRQCAVDKKGIDDMTVFDDTIDKINQLYNQLDLYTGVDDSENE